jgi:hypothetical protein
MVVRIDKIDRELRTDSSVICHDPERPDPVHFFERSVINSIQNAIDFATDTRKHGVGPENR